MEITVSLSGTEEHVGSMLAAEASVRVLELCRDFKEVYVSISVTETGLSAAEVSIQMEPGDEAGHCSELLHELGVTVCEEMKSDVKTVLKPEDGSTDQKIYRQTVRYSDLREQETQTEIDVTE